MKKSLAFVAALIPFCVAGPLSAHHAAEGIVADDIYEMITTNLEDADSPHLDLDLTMTTATVTVTVPAEDVAEVLTIISDALAGQGEQVTSSIEVEISAADADDLVTITVTEDLGQGESQMF